MHPEFSINKTSKLGWILKGLLIIGFFIIFARLFELQIIKGEYYQGLSYGNRIRRVPIEAPRGEISARGGEKLVINREALKFIEFLPEGGYKKVLESSYSAEAVNEWEREYLLGAGAAHVSGYVGEVNADEVGKVNPNCQDKGVLNQGQLVGRSGLEASYECALSGRNGEILVEVDSQGKFVRYLGKKEVQTGIDLITNIDYGLQQKVSDVMEGKIGAIVATDVSGEVLALYSSPSFDPNIFTGEVAGNVVSSLLDDPNKPFFNRAISGTYHPGSVFKPVVAVAALSEGKIDKNFLYEDKGKIIVETTSGDFSYANWYLTQYGGVEGYINVVRAIARSTDTFFYKVGEFLGPDKIAEWANKFGMGEASGIDLPGEAVGLIPTPEWKKEVKGESWFLGNTYHVSIGQGDLAVTPLSINMATNVVASKGKFCKPVIYGEASCRDLGIEKHIIEIVEEGMIAACSEGGTGLPFFSFEPKVACKTGTAQTGTSDKAHAWFTVYLPESTENLNPERAIVLTILVEEGGEGSVVAAPIAKEILEYWLGIEPEVPEESPTPSDN